MIYHFHKKLSLSFHKKEVIYKYEINSAREISLRLFLKERLYKMKLFKVFTKVMAAVITLSGCNSPAAEMSGSPVSTESRGESINSAVTLEEDATFSNECFIELGNIVSINGKGAWLDDNCIKISESGVYTVSGTLSDGMIYVESEDVVKLILKNAEIKNDNGPAIISESEKLIIKSEENSRNTLKDSKEYNFSREFEDPEKHTSAIYSKGTLIFTGKGALDIKSKHNDAVTSEETLNLRESNITIDAEDAGLVGAKGITLNNLNLNITSEKDCIKTGSYENASISVNNSNLYLSSEKNDGIQAESLLFINGGNLDITTGGDINADSELSSKGIKAGELKLTDADITISSTDHAVKSDGVAELSGGSLTLSSSMGKGITAEGELTINETSINVSDAEEGIESKSVLTIKNGNISIRSRDDGINTGGEENSGDHSLNINGGSVFINSDGDGIDSNGSINIMSGSVIIFGSERDDNSALDCGDNGGKINITGGNVIALGSAGMVKAPEGGYLFSRVLNAKKDDVVTVVNANNAEIFSVTSPKTAQSVIFSDNTAAEGYKILLNGKEIALSEIKNRGGRRG